MAYFDFLLRSRSLCKGLETSVSVILPPCAKKQTPAEFFGGDKKFKVLWLLHGTLSDSSTFVRKTMVEVFAEERNLIVVTPSVMASDYSNWPGFAAGYNAEDFLVDELMPLIYGWFPASDKREDNYIAGASMGGRGAFSYALAYPEKFAGAIILSGSVKNYRKLFDKPYEELDQRSRNVIDNAGGLDAYLASWGNVYERLAEIKDPAALPKFHISCGTKDGSYPLYRENQAYYKQCGIDAKYVDIPDVGHEFRCFNAALEDALNYFNI